MKKIIAAWLAILIVFTSISIFSMPSSSQVAQEMKFYLHEDRTDICGKTDVEIMYDIEPWKMNDSTRKFDREAVEWYMYPPSYCSIYINSAEACLYMKGFIGLHWINVSLIDVFPDGEEKLINSSKRIVSLLPYLLPYPFYDFQKYSFSFKNVDYEIETGHSIALKVKTCYGILPSWLVYDSIYHPSYLALNCTTYGKIELECYDSEKEIQPWETAKYDILIYNDGPVGDDVSLDCDYEEKGWNVSISPSSVYVEAYGGMGYAILSVSPVSSPSNVNRGTNLTVIVTGTGKTGSDSVTTITTVPKEFYDVEVTAPTEGQKGEPGEEITYRFTISNKGNVNDTYDLEVISNWTAEVQNSVSIPFGREEEVDVIVKIPSDATNGSTDILTLKATSQNSTKNSSAMVTTTVKIVSPPPSMFEKIWNSMKSLARQIGFYDYFGDSAPFALLAIIIAIAIVIIFVVRYATRKWIEIGCLDRLIEVVPGKTATFDVDIRNPLKRKNIYRLKAEGEIPKNWDARIDKDVVALNGGDGKSVSLKVSVPDDASIDQWASIDIVGEPVKKPRKRRKATAITILKEGKPSLSIANVEHEPSVVKGGEKVVTRAEIRNNGDAVAKSVDIVFFVNDEERNRIDNVDIPPNNFAKVEIPWIANEGENRIKIKLE